MPRVPSSGSAVLHGFFFLSGAAALGFQIAWTRMLSTGLGQEMPAVLAVLGAIFGGMALGAWAGDKMLDRFGLPGRCYGWLELIIGCWALISIPLTNSINGTVPRWIGLHSGPLAHWAISLILPGLILLPATTAMGATFPAIERFVAPLAARGRCVGGLYAANTLGAVAGVMASTTFALPALGFARTVALFSGISLVCGAAALCLVKRLGCAGSAPSAERRPAAAETGRRDLRLATVLWMSGLLGIGFEVLGVRVLSQVLENTVYTFAAVLAVYLSGIAIGGALYQVAGRRWTSNRLFLWLSLAVLTGAWMLALTPSLYRGLRGAFSPSAAGLWTAEFMTAATVFALPTILMGAVFSHLVQSAKGRSLGVGSAVGLNTLGGAFAPLVFGVLVFPWVGAKWSFVLLGLGYLVLAWPLSGWPLWFAAVPVALAFLLPAELPSRAARPEEKILVRREGISSSAAVVERADGNRSLIVNRRFMMGGTAAFSAERRHASLPLLLHPNPQRALFLGLGTGITFAAAGPHPGLRADGVELAPEIVELLPWFEPHNKLPPDPVRFRIYTADARRFVRVCPERYDVIVADLFHPSRDGAGALYSLEHFQGVRNQLAPGGLACQWLPLYQLDEPILRVIVRTFLEVLPHTRAFLLRFNVDTPVLGLVGTLSPTFYSADYFERRVRDPGLRESLRGEQLSDDYQLFGCFIAGSEALARFSQGAAFNTDDWPVVLFGAPAFNLRPNTASYTQLMHLLASFSSDPSELFGPGDPATARMARELQAFIAARDVYLRGLVAEAEGAMSAAIEAFVESARLSPEFSTGYAHALNIAMRESRTDPAAARDLLERLAAAQPNRPVARQLLKRLFP